MCACQRFVAMELYKIVLAHYMYKWEPDNLNVYNYYLLGFFFWGGGGSGVLCKYLYNITNKGSYFTFYLENKDQGMCICDFYSFPLKF